MKTLTTTLLMLIVGGSILHAQYASSGENQVIIHLGENQKMVLVYNDLGDLKKMKAVGPLVKQVVPQLPAVSEKLSNQYTPVHVSWNPPGHLKVRQENISAFGVATDSESKTSETSGLQPGTKVKLDPDTLQITLTTKTKYQSVSNQVIFLVDRLESMEAVSQMELDTIIQRMIRNMTEEGHDFLGVRYTYKANYSQNSNGEWDLSRNQIRHDQIELAIDFGAGTVRDRMVPELGFNLAFNFGNYAVQNKQSIGLSYKMLYFFEDHPDGGFATHINTFLELRYAYNMSNNPDKPHWYTMGAGLLMREKGGYFENTTYRFSVSHRIGKSRYHVEPQLYVTNNWKTAFPSLKLGVNF